MRCISEGATGPYGETDDFENEARRRPLGSFIPESKMLKTGYGMRKKTNDNESHDGRAVACQEPSH